MGTNHKMEYSPRQPFFTAFLGVSLLSKNGGVSPSRAAQVLKDTWIGTARIGLFTQP